MRITKWGELGILCSLFLAARWSEGKKTVGAPDISDSQGIPIQYTQQILQRLRKGGIIESVRGPRGGYQLAAEPEALTLRQILTAAEGDTFEVICETNPIYSKNCETSHQCGLRNVWHDLKRTVDSFLEERTLASVLAEHEFVDHSSEGSGADVLVNLQKNS